MLNQAEPDHFLTATPDSLALLSTQLICTALEESATAEVSVGAAGAKKPTAGLRELPDVLRSTRDSSASIWVRSRAMGRRMRRPRRVCIPDTPRKCSTQPDSEKRAACVAFAVAAGALVHWQRPS